MKFVKKTAQYSIYQRGDDRYAVKDARKKPVNGEEKARILLVEELIKIVRPAKPAVAEAPPVDASAAAESSDVGETPVVDEAGEEPK